MPRDPARKTHEDFCRPYHDDSPLVAAVCAQTATRAMALAQAEVAIATA